MKNNPLLARNAVDDIRRQAKQLKTRQGSHFEAPQPLEQSETQEEASDPSGEKKDSKKEERKPREFFGQFKRGGGKAGVSARLDDVFQKKVQGTKELAD